MTTEADIENRNNLLSVTPLVWRNETTGQIVCGGDELTPLEFEKRMCFDPDDPEVCDNSEQDPTNPARVKVWPDTWNGESLARWYRGEQA